MNTITMKPAKVTTYMITVTHNWFCLIAVRFHLTRSNGFRFYLIETSFAWLLPSTGLINPWYTSIVWSYSERPQCLRASADSKISVLQLVSLAAEQVITHEDCSDSFRVRITVEPLVHSPLMKTVFFAHDIFLLTYRISIIEVWFSYYI